MNSKKLITPDTYLIATPEEKGLVVNTCGPEGFLNQIIPNTIFGSSVVEACNRHDWMLNEAKSKEELKVADSTFKHNLEVLTANPNDGPILRALKFLAIRIYFGAVRLNSYFKGAMLDN